MSKFKKGLLQPKPFHQLFEKIGKVPLIIEVRAGPE